MLPPLNPAADERAAMAMLDLASGLDAGLATSQLGGDPQEGDEALASILVARKVALAPPERILLQAAWRAGQGPLALRRLAQQRSERADLGKNLRRSLLYPCTVATLSLAVSTLVAGIVGWWLPFLIAALLGAAVGAFVWLARRAAEGAAPWTRIPVLGPLAQDLAQIPYLETLHGLYAAGVPLLAAHPIAVAASGAVGCRQALAPVDALLQQGRPLHEAMALGPSAIHPETLTLVSAGEKIGNLEEALLRAARRRRDQASQGMRRLGTVLGGASYALGIAVALLTILAFYSSYARLLGGLR